MDENDGVKSKDSKELALHYMKTLVDVARESFLILDSSFVVLAVNPMFLDIFKVSLAETENKLLFDLGNGQWDIPELKKLLKEILPEKKNVRDYSVTHVFETIGEKTILLNAGQIDSVQLIILAMEDITARRLLEKKVEDYTKQLETKVIERTAELTEKLKELELLNKSMVGRELKMLELKNELQKMKKEE